MCEAPICKCHCKPALKLEVGKKYLTSKGSVLVVVGVDGKKYVASVKNHCILGADDKGYYPFTRDGKSLDESRCSNIVSEYKEPEYWYVIFYNSPIIAYRVDSIEAGKKFAGSSLQGMIRINKETKVIEQLPI